MPKLSNNVVIAEWVDRSYTQSFKTNLESLGYNVIVLNNKDLRQILSYEPLFVAFAKTYVSVGWWYFAAKLFFMGVPVFTWGNDSQIPFLHFSGYGCNKCAGTVESVTNHPIVSGITSLPNSSCDYRRCITDASPHATVLAKDTTNNFIELVLLEKPHPFAGTSLWLHYHPHPAPPTDLLSNWINYIYSKVEDGTPYGSLMGQYGGIVIIGGPGQGTPHNPNCTDGYNPNSYAIKLTALIVKKIYDGFSYLTELSNYPVQIIRSSNDGGHWSCPSGVRDSLTYWFDQWGIPWTEVSTYTELEALYLDPHGIIINTHGEAMPIPPAIYSIYDPSTGWDSNYKNNIYQFYREYLYRVVTNGALHIEPIGYTWYNATQNGMCTSQGAPQGVPGGSSIYRATYYATGGYVSDCWGSTVKPTSFIAKHWQKTFNETPPTGFWFSRTCHPYYLGAYGGFQPLYQGRVGNRGWTRHSIFVSYGPSKLFREVIV